jgi:hypothetical protein
MCVLILSATFVWNISHSKNNWVRYYHKGTQSFISTRHFLSHFNQTWIFLTKFQKNPPNKISWKSAKWELIGNLRNFANAPKKKLLHGCFSVPLLPSIVQAAYWHYVTPMPPVVYGRKYKIRWVDRLGGNLSRCLSVRIWVWGWFSYP